ncbi:hypothetical protein B484DRAFT_126176 [Ochromonadaceae sp. CCMP2298]|nr:hypothetical protein B484DRAFT_126176 [Ochromonadaceae sp. CCMP2298]
MAAVCSCLKYYGHALIGVARDEDRVLLNDMLQSKLSPEALRRTNVVQFSMPKPAHLPFHLLAWGQRYVQTRNCAAFYNPADQMALGMVAGGGGGGGAAGGGKGVGVEVQGRLLAEAGTNASHSIVGSGNRTIGSGSTGGTGDTGGMYIRATGGVGGTSVGGAGGRGKFPTQDMLDSILKERTVDPGKVPQNELFDICRARGVVGSIGGPVKVVYMRKWDFGLGGHRRGHGQSQGQDRGQRQTQGEGQERSRRKLPPIKFIYYTESDQVVRFDSPATLAALSSASNESCFFVGKRREKSRDTDPAQYMSGLNSWRECGVPGYSLSWPKHTHVQLD